MGDPQYKRNPIIKYYVKHFTAIFRPSHTRSKPVFNSIWGNSIKSQCLSIARLADRFTVSVFKTEFGNGCHFPTFLFRFAQMSLSPPTTRREHHKLSLDAFSHARFQNASTSAIKSLEPRSRAAVVGRRFD